MIIIGAQGFAKELLTVLNWNDAADHLYFFDNVTTDMPDHLYGIYPVLKSWQALKDYISTQSPEFILGVGGTSIRMSLSEKVQSLGGKLCSLTSSHALIGKFGNIIGDGACIMSQATITCDVCIGEGTLVNKGSIISHDVVIGKYSEISPGVRVLGHAKIGDLTEIGTNAVILPHICVGSCCKVGAGAVVTKDVPDHSTVVGIPAKSIRPIKT